MGIYKKKYYPEAEKQLPPKSLGPVSESSKPKTILNIKAQDKPSFRGGSTPGVIHRVLSKMAFGPSDSDVAHIQSLSGATDQDKILNYIDEQLDPSTINDSTLEAMLTQGFTTLNKSRIQLYQDHLRRPNGVSINWEDHIRPSRETVYATFLRGHQSPIGR